MLRAGILPRLEARCLVVDVEAASGPGRTEARLLAAVRAADPRLPQGSPLRETLASVRRGSDLAVGTKLVIVLDPFEPWLATEPDARGNDLAEALRQCDGRRLAALLVVRDDFTLQAARFLEQVEVPLVQGRNFAIVEPFEPGHARTVLLSFGRALKNSPPSPSRWTRPRSSSSTDRRPCWRSKVASTRLGSRCSPSWWPTAPGVPGRSKAGAGPRPWAWRSSTRPSRRSRPTRCWVAGPMPSRRSWTPLAPRRGWRSRGRPARAGSWPPWRDSRRIRPKPPRSCAVLDGDLRLITPASDEAEERPGVHYQLTHDYLVAPLRRWLNRDRMSTFRGRLGVRLSELAADWAARPSPGNLPGWWELPLLELGTDRGLRTEPERRMLAAARRRHGARAAAALVGSGVLALLALIGQGRIEARRLEDRTEAAVLQLLRSAPEAVEDAFRASTARARPIPSWPPW